MHWFNLYKLASEEQQKRDILNQIDALKKQKKNPLDQFMIPRLLQLPLATLQDMLAKEQHAQQQRQQWEQMPMPTVPKPPEIPEDLWDQYGDEVQSAIDTTFSRYIWGTKKQIKEALQNGMKMHKLEGSYYGIHVGDEGWIATLARDYQRSGPVCQVDIFDLPEGFFVVDDPDIMDRTNTPDSHLLISQQAVIPPQCLKIVAQLNTEKVSKNYPHIMNEFGEEYPS